MFRNLFAGMMVIFQKWMRDWNESRKAEGENAIGLHEIMWKMKWLRYIFPECCLYEWLWRLIHMREERRFWRYLEEGNKRFGRPLIEAEVEKLKDYEDRYTEIRLHFMSSHITIAGLCMDYMFFSEDSGNDGGRVCRLLFHEGEFDAYITPNAYLTNRYSEFFETITKENCSFWYEYLKRNRKRVIVETSFTYKRRQYDESRQYMETGKEITHKAMFSFSEEEEKKGEKALNSFGISGPYVCVFARDGRYNAEMRHVSTFEEDSLDLRNSDINTFKKMTQFLVGKGIQSVRMGALMAEEYHCEGAVDYANIGRTDFLDVYIFSKCRFYIGDCSGISGIPIFWGKPVAFINMHVSLFHTDYSQSMTLGIFLKYYDPISKRYLRLREWCAKYIECCERNMDYSRYIRNHYEIVRNSSQEILDIAKEMEAIQNRTLQYTKHDEELQRRYRKIIRGFQMLFPIVECPYPGRIGMQWLRDNEWFLE